jgi:hypothetical protein
MIKSKNFSRQINFDKLIFSLAILLLPTPLIADQFDSVKSNLKIINDLKDIYRAYNINHIITSQKEMITLFIDDENSLNGFLNSCLKVCDSLKKQHISDGSLKRRVGNYLSHTINNFKLMKDKGINSVEFKMDLETYKTYQTEYLKYIASNFPMNRFTDLTEEKYWETLEKTNYIKSKEYSTYLNLKKANLQESLLLLTKISQKTIDFQERTIYQIELADQYVKHNDVLENGDQIAIERYKAILNENKYCLYLFESWLKWRTVYQQNNGLSITSDIPNNDYNKIRDKEALLLLDYISRNSKDDMAINQFLLFATHDIVRRFGSYKYGNQNTLEYHDMFDSKN